MKPETSNDEKRDTPRPYTAPRVRELGHVHELTRGGVSSTMSDHGSDMMWTS